MPRFTDVVSVAEQRPPDRGGHGSSPQRLRWEPRIHAGAPHEDLARAIESEIIPRLMLVHRDAAVKGGDARPTRGDVAEFTRVVLEHEMEVGLSLVEVMLAKGTPIDGILLHLLAPAARLLGDLWREDICSFGEVTIGLSRLQQILRRLGANRDADVGPPSYGHRALLAATPGETHTFGVNVVQDFLCRAGWDVSCNGVRNQREIVAAVRHERFDVLALSLSCDALLERLSSVIQAARRASSNPAIGILVGGRVFVDHPEYVALVRADAMALDGLDAVDQAGRLVGSARRYA